MQLNGKMKLLVTSRGSSGSWSIRGEQLGSAIGAVVQKNASAVRGFDLAILVKRSRADLLHRLRTVGVPIVWDIVDAWPQPDGNNWGRETCMSWLRQEVSEIKPVGLVAATRAMVEDCKEFGVPVLCLPHHSRPDQRLNPIRDIVQAVGYEGSVGYLGYWKDALELECGKRDWRFLINPHSLSELDIVVAFRSMRGYAAQRWKSNVKLANAQGSGTPCIMNTESGYQETDRGGVFWLDEPNDLPIAFDCLSKRERRKQAAEKLFESRITIEDTAHRYSEWLHQLKF